MFPHPFTAFELTRRQPRAPSSSLHGTPKDSLRLVVRSKAFASSVYPLSPAFFSLLRIVLLWNLPHHQQWARPFWQCLTAIVRALCTVLTACMSVRPFENSPLARGLLIFTDRLRRGQAITSERPSQTRTLPATRPIAGSLADARLLTRLFGAKQWHVLGCPRAAQAVEFSFLPALTDTKS